VLELPGDERPMNLDDMKQEAAVAANEIQIDWEMMDNPNYRADFEHVLKKAMVLIPDLESILVKLNSGTSVLFPGENTSLKFEDIEKYKQIVEDELFNGYVLQELLHKYEMVNAVITADNNGPLDKGDPTQLDLGI
jgi:phage pi2 protein 07